MPNYDNTALKEWQWICAKARVSRRWFLDYRRIRR